MAKLKFGNENIIKANDAKNAESIMPSAPILKATINKIRRCPFRTANGMIYYPCYKKKCCQYQLYDLVAQELHS
jgi:hypothetical protein